jgi:hypothetical protein
MKGANLCSGGNPVCNARSICKRAVGEGALVGMFFSQETTIKPSKTIGAIKTGETGALIMWNVRLVTFQWYSRLRLPLPDSLGVFPRLAIGSVGKQKNFAAWQEFLRFNRPHLERSQFGVSFQLCRRK